MGELFIGILYFSNSFLKFDISYLSSMNYGGNLNSQILSLFIIICIFKLHNIANADISTPL